MKVGEQAIYLARLKGLSTAEAQKRLKVWFGKFDILAWWDKKLEELSKGMQQKVQFIITVVHDPELLIFDEPFSGFDPVNTNLLKEEILLLRANGATIIFSTHNMSSVEEICDSIALINKSQKILEGKVKDIKQSFKKNQYEVIINNEINIEDLLVEGCNLIKRERSNETQSSVLSIDKGKNADLLSNILKHTDVISYREILPSMNEIFIQTVRSHE
jgi:ABC-2 type transport system ATP-binding protein